MRWSLFLLLGGVFVQPTIAAPQADHPSTAPADYAQPGPHEVASLRVDWTDSARERPVPAKIYYPGDGDGPFPVVIFSHGLGGSREGYAYLGRHWAGHAYVCVHLEHEGSDDQVWRGQNNAADQMQRAAKDPANAINRPLDVSFAIDRLTAMNGEEGPLKDRLDLQHIAVAGHSFGAFTALAIAGEAGTYTPEGEPSRQSKGRSVRPTPTRVLSDARVTAFIALSAPVPAGRTRFDAIYGRIGIPGLHMTGTLDESPIALTKAEDRRIPYDHIRRADQYLVTFIGGDHMVFSGRPRRGRAAEKDEAFQQLIQAGTTAFLDAYLRCQPESLAWLQTGGFKAALGAHARLEQKRASSQPAPPEDKDDAVQPAPSRAGERKAARPVPRRPVR